MRVLGLVTGVGDIRAKGDRRYRTVFVEGMPVSLPSEQVDSPPANGEYVDCTVRVYWPEKNGNERRSPMYFADRVAPAQVVIS